MTTFLMILFVILCFFLALAILIQQGKGDMGLGGLGGGGQTLFGGSGGQDVFEKATWVMGALFIFGSLGLTILKNKEIMQSRIKNPAAIIQEQKTQPKMPLPPKDLNQTEKK